MLPAPQISTLFPYTTLFRSDGTSADPALAGGDELVFRRPQVQPTVLRRLRGGEYRVERSEEHTSELQSHLNLVCRLLLEKKKKIKRHVIDLSQIESIWPILL